MGLHDEDVNQLGYTVLQMSALTELLESPKNPVVIMAVGAAASGKTSVLAPLCEHYGLERLSPSEIRSQMRVDEQDPKGPLKVWGELHRRVDQALREGRSVVIDAKNTENWRRPREIQYYKDHGARVVAAAFFDVPLSEIQKRNKKRVAHEQDSKQELVSSYVQLKSDPPTLDEGFDQVIKIEEVL